MCPDSNWIEISWSIHAMNVRYRLNAAVKLLVYFNA